MSAKNKNDKTNPLNTIHAYLYARKRAVTVISTLATVLGLVLMSTGETELMIVGGVLFGGGLVPFAFIGQRWQ